MTEMGSDNVGTLDETPVGTTLTSTLRRRIFKVPTWWRRGGWRRLLGCCAVLLMLIVMYFAVSLFQVWSTGQSHHQGSVDAIVVMGAAQYDGRPSPQLQARLDHVVELWNQGVAPTVIVTGGNQPGDRFTEAESSTNYLVEYGVPVAVILAEDTGHSSWESLQNVAALASERGITRIVLVSDPYHTLRVRLMAEELGFQAYTSSTQTGPVKGWNNFKRHLQEAAGVALGRVLGFARVESLAS
ncbi:MAG: hypothetical protein RL688_1590 [Actinomycetota bacterium]